MEINRRSFLKVLGATGAAVAVPGCTRKPPSSIVPYVIPADQIIPGKAVWYASVCSECPAGCGIHVKVQEGRAIKIEGNPDHPVNGGRLCSRGQAALQGLYNPDRLQTPMRRREDGGWDKLTWEEATDWLVTRLQEIRSRRKGSGIAWLTSNLTGSLDELVDEWLAAFGSSRRLRYEPVGYEALRGGNRLTFGRDEIPHYDFGAAKAILSFGADFLETWVSPVEFSRGFAQTRSAEDRGPSPFIYFGPRRSLTAANADEWIPLHPEDLGAVALSLVHILLEEGLASGLSAGEARRIRRIVAEAQPAGVAQRTGLDEATLRSIARLFAEAAPGLAVAGDVSCENPTGAATVAAVNLLNYVCGNIGRTIRFGSPHSLSAASTFADILQLIRSMNEGVISALFVTGCNPAYSVPASAGFVAALEKVPLVVACSSSPDETVAQADLVLPIHTPLESWGDVQPRRGVRGLMQPVMQPVFDTRLLGDLLLELASKVDPEAGRRLGAATFYDYLRSRWRVLHRRLSARQDFEAFWYDTLRRGGVWERMSEPRLSLAARLGPETLRPLLSPRERPKDRFRLVAYPSLHFFDGRGANRPWLQEVPDPITQCVWDSWVHIHHSDASRLKVRHGERVRIWSSQASIELPVYVDDGVHPGVVAIAAGQGHTAFGRYADGHGTSVYPLLPAHAVEGTDGLGWGEVDVQLNPTGEPGGLVSVAGSDTQQGRGLVQAVPLSELGHASEEHHEEIQMYPKHEHPEHRWGMTIDLNKCTGCSACVTACYAENNIPVVGKRLVAQGREMAWIRVERFYENEGKRGQIRFAPMLCQQCDNAPCESVCPVYAAYHTPEGLNAQVYNRCIGTRYCSNNCPYKVRRFNWFTYEWPEPLNWLLNPDVTVRSKGVMEKCTFCVQRIVAGKNRAREEGRPVQDGDIVPACAQACPTEAIVFGDLGNDQSRVSQGRKDNANRGYRSLEELNTQPAITYFKKIIRDDQNAV